MYKDPYKQREANRKAQAKFKAKGITKQGIIEGITDRVLPKDVPPHGLTAGFESTEFVKPKRGKDIRCFEDLSPDVQETIVRLSMVDGKIDQSIKANRTAIAIHYQHQFPYRYYSTGVPC